MPRNHAIAAAVLLVALGCSCAQAGDFVPRTTGSFAAVGEGAATVSTCPEATSTAAMSDADAVAAHDGVAAASVHSGPTRSAKHIGVDDVVTDAHTAAVADDDKAAGAHKSRAAARWQSLLPGVMK